MNEVPGQGGFVAQTGHRDQHQEVILLPPISVRRGGQGTESNASRPRRRSHDILPDVPGLRYGFLQPERRKRASALHSHRRLDRVNLVYVALVMTTWLPLAATSDMFWTIALHHLRALLEDINIVDWRRIHCAVSVTTRDPRL